MASEKDLFAINLTGWETGLTAEIPDHIVLSLLFSVSEEERKAGKGRRMRFAISREKALELSKDLAEAANTPLPPRSHPERH